MLPVVELFTSIQGEGKYIGVPSHFVRVSGCNLRCVFKDSICDTSYASFNPEKSRYKTNEDFYEAFEQQCVKYPHVRHVVITGGEPLMYKEELETFLNKFKHYHLTVTIETNGSQNPLSKDLVDLYSISPKLSTSVGKSGIYQGITVTEEMIQRHDANRINIESLTSLITNSKDYQLKFVYSDNSCIDEIESIIKKLVDYSKNLGELEQGLILNADEHIMLMPEGIINDQLKVHREEIAQKCIENGWTMTDREHIIIWGDKREV